MCRWGSAVPYAPSWFNPVSYILINVFGYYLKENPWELNPAPVTASQQESKRFTLD